MYREPTCPHENLYQDGKTCAIPSLHRDKFLAKVPGPCPVQRQVTPTNFIAGPLAQIFVAVRLSPRTVLIKFYLYNNNSALLPGSALARQTAGPPSQDSSVI
jgi:hypothetical protein